MRKAFIISVLAVAAVSTFFMVYNTNRDTRVFSLDAYKSRSLYVSQFTIPPMPTPPINKVKAVHLAYGAYFSDSFLRILGDIESSQINSIVFEVKDPYGRVAINSELHNSILGELLPQLKRAGVYTIARMVIFQDPAFIENNPSFGIKNKLTGEPWTDYKGIVWADPTRGEVWKYNTDIAARALKMGFNEINFDYVRFPTDGPLKQAEYANLDKYVTNENAISSFLQFARKDLGSNARISVDVFGMTFLDNQYVIGQNISEMAKHVNVIAPMPYPSHYPDGFIGFSNPAEYPYEIVHYTLEKGFKKLEGSSVIVRPWIQDFDLGAVYDERKIKEQIRAVNDFDIDTWMLWNASNRYTFEAVR
ncbi:MAG: putative glycoside hydrolase [Candidatus Spechtbacteria bacterium]|nr:putative glycoside hydrolase [Candidatus Spechtbacteria bacterium]